MGNTCVGPSISKNAIFQSVSGAAWWPRSSAATDGGESVHGSVFDGRAQEPESPTPVQNKPPEQVTIPKGENKPGENKPGESKSSPPQQPKKPTKPHHRRVESAGLQVDSVLLRKTGHLKEH